MIALDRARQFLEVLELAVFEKGLVAYFVAVHSRVQDLLRAHTENRVERLPLVAHRLGSLSH